MIGQIKKGTLNGKCGKGKQKGYKLVVLCSLAVTGFRPKTLFMDGGLLEVLL